METLEETARVITSKPAQRAAVNVVLLVSSAVTLFGLAAFATALFFQSFVPDQFISSPVYLQYQSGINPYGIAHLAYPAPKTQQEYDISVNLTMPPSMPNTERGNFMVSLYLVKGGDKTAKVAAGRRKSSDNLEYLDGHTVLFEARRPALLPHEDAIISMARRFFFLFYYIIFPQSQARTMTIQLAERVSFAKSSVQPTSAFVEIEAGQDIQIYKTFLTLTAQLRGLRYIMYHYRLLSYVAFTLLFWVCEVLFMCVAWALWVSATATATSPKALRGKRDYSTDGERTYDDDDDEHSDRAGRSIMYGRQAGVKKELLVKDEDEDSEPRISDIPPVDADDEDGFDEDDEDLGGHRRDEGMGTSYREEGQESVRRRASRNLME